MTPDDVDVNANKHTGQIALRKLYHESPRPIVVLYTAKTCGPCRTLKPILNAVAEEYGNQVWDSPLPPPPPPQLDVTCMLKRKRPAVTYATAGTRNRRLMPWHRRISYDMHTICFRLHQKHLAPVHHAIPWA